MIFLADFAHHIQYNKWISNHLTTFHQIHFFKLITNDYKHFDCIVAICQIEHNLINWRQWQRVNDIHILSLSAKESYESEFVFVYMFFAVKLHHLQSLKRCR